MNSIDLSGLKGLHIPQQPDVFPLAYGWWLALIIGFLFAVILFFLIVSFWQSRCNLVLKELRQIKKVKDTRRLLIELNDLAKRLAICKLGREKIALLYGQKWIDFLNSGKRKIFSQDYVDLLHKTLYTKNNKLDDSLRGRIIKDYSKWIKDFLLQ